VKTVFDKLMAGEVEPVECFENTVLTKSGEERIIAWHNTVLTDEEGNIIGTLSSGEDVTERKQAEEALRQSEENLKVYLESAPDGVYINDLKGTFLYGNKKAEALMGYKREELIGKSFLKLKILPGKYLAKAGKLLALNVMGKPTGPDEFELARKDGSRVWVEINTAPIKQRGEGVVIGFVRDITERKRAEEELELQRAHFRQLFENSPEGIVLLDDADRVLDANEGFERLFQYSIEEIKGRLINEIIVPENRFEEASAISRDARNKKVARREAVRKRKDGSLVDVSVLGYPIQLTSKSIGVYAIYNDVTERKQAEEALERSEEQLRSVVQTASDAISITNSSGNIIFWNNAAEDMFGYTSGEIIGKPVTTIMPERFRAFFGDAFKKTIVSGEMQAREAITERFGIRKDGSEFPIEISDAQWKIKEDIFFTSIIRDVTEHKQAEEEIKHAAEEWRTTFDSITDFVSICDKDFKLVRVNKAFADAFKMKPAELIGKHCYEIIHGANEPVPNCPQKVTIKTKKPATAEFFEPHLGMHLEMSTSPIFNEKGEVVACVHVIRDITERKKMEEQLIVTDRLSSIGELASGIAHELNNPLTSVIGFSDLLLEKDIPDDIREDLSVVNREAKRTAEVVQNLLIFARKHPPGKQLVNINSIIEKVLELRAYEQKVSNIQVNTRFAPDLTEIMADGFQLQQVFLNIIINAEHFMIEANNRGTLTITTERVEDIIKASFADDGPGIAKENLGHLFDPFFTTKEVGKGTGLGLSICHGIISEHGGKIYAESKLGKGATFVVELPLTSADEKGEIK